MRFGLAQKDKTLTQTVYLKSKKNMYGYIFFKMSYLNVSEDILNCT